MQGNSTDNVRLDSWKEIAAYLHRDIRTVIRWEKEKGLPIHRIPGGKRQAVFTYQNELDTWLISHDERTRVPGVPDLSQEIIQEPEENVPDISPGNLALRRGSRYPLLRLVRLPKQALVVGSVCG